MSGSPSPPPAYGAVTPSMATEAYQQGPVSEKPPAYSNEGYTASTSQLPQTGHQQQYTYPPTVQQQTPYPPAHQHSPYPPTNTGYNTQQNYNAYSQQPTAVTEQYTHTASPTGQQLDSSNHVGRDYEDSMAKFSEKSIRLGFIKKVFAILNIMLVVTFGIMCLFMFVEDIREYAKSHSWLYITSVIVYVAAAIVLMCVGETRRKFPQNIICLCVITLAMGVMLGCITASFEVKEVMIAVGIVIIITIAMMLLGFQNKIDFTPLVGVMFVAVLSLMGFGLMAAIFRSDILYIFYASLGALIFSLYIVIDVQLIIGGKHKYSMSPEEYILAALSLYLDIVNLFIYILMIVAYAKK